MTGYELGPRGERPSLPRGVSTYLAMSAVTGSIALLSWILVVVHVWNRARNLCVNEAGLPLPRYCGSVTGNVVAAMSLTCWAAVLLVFGLHRRRARTNGVRRETLG